MNRHERRRSASAARRVQRQPPITVSAADVAAMHAVEKFVLAYQGDDLGHDIELTFPGVSYRAVFLALRRARHAARWFKAEGNA
jgi:hypothetical protein